MYQLQLLHFNQINEEKSDSCYSQGLRINAKASGLSVFVTYDWGHAWVSVILIKILYFRL